MNQAWYARADVLRLRDELARESSVGSTPLDRGRAIRPAARPLSDAELIAYLRAGSRTAVDLVADAGISVARATRVYRFWVEHEGGARASVEAADAGTATAASVRAARTPASMHGDRANDRDRTRATPPASPATPSTAPRAAGQAEPPHYDERRGRARVERDRLIAELRDPDPTVRARAFEKLKSRRNPHDPKS